MVFRVMYDELNKIITLPFQYDGFRKFVDYNPYFAIMKNSQLMSQRQEMSFNDYYAKYGTTEPRDGWHMENPTGNQVIYVKAG